PRTEQAAEQHDRIIRDVFRAGSKVRILVENHTPTPKKYIVERVVGSPPKVYDWDDARSEQGALLDVPASHVMPHAEVYGQGEIDGLSLSQTAQVEIIERFVNPTEMEELNRAEETLLQSLTQNTEQLANLEDDKDALDRYRQRLAEVKDL